jgi:hypothetical protein
MMDAREDAKKLGVGPKLAGTTPRGESWDF